MGHGKVDVVMVQAIHQTLHCRPYTGKLTYFGGLGGSKATFLEREVLSITWGTWLITNFLHPPRAIINPDAWSYWMVLGESCLL